jgi:hypothetical protein
MANVAGHEDAGLARLEEQRFAFETPRAAVAVAVDEIGPVMR